MATGEEKPKYTHYSLSQAQKRERISCLYSSDRAQSSSFPTNIVQCLQLDHVISKHRYRQYYVNNGLARAKYLYSQNVFGHTGCVNAVNFSNSGEELLVSGGDDEKVQLWRVSEIMRGKYQSVPMETPHCSNIFTATFSCDNAYIYSGGNDANLIKHDAATGRQVSVHPHSEAVYSVSAHPFSPDTIITASEDGVVRTIDSRLPHFTEDTTLVDDCDAFQCVTFNPIEPCLVATGNTRLGAALCDTRTHKKVFSYHSSKYRIFGEDVVSVNFSGNGKFLFTMQRRQAPCLYKTTQPNVAATFMDEKGEYMNIVSMKSGCFVGTNDEYVASGSDDFRVYIWRIPEDLEAVQSKVIDSCVVPSPHLVLPGHRSIANQIRYSPTHHLLCSSGVEKIIKLWSHMPLSSEATLQHSGGPPSRKRYTPREFLHFSTSEESDDNMIPNTPEQEDRAVLAFFDALVNEEERSHNWYDTMSDDSDSPGSLLSDLASSDESLSGGVIWPASPFDYGPVDFMRYPYPDEEPGRATWDFMTPQERWDWHHGRRDWFYEDRESNRSSTPSSIETRNTSSFEPPWSDDSETERDAGFSVDEVEEELGEGDNETEGGGGRGTRKGRRYRSQGHSNHRRDCDKQTPKDNGKKAESCDSTTYQEKDVATTSRSGEKVKRKPGSKKRSSDREPPFKIIFRGPGSTSQKSNEGTSTQTACSLPDSQQPSTSAEAPAVPSGVPTGSHQTKEEHGNEEQRENNAEDSLKPIPPVRFYSSCQNSNNSVPTQLHTVETPSVSNGVKKKLCSQGQESAPSTSSGYETKLGTGENSDTTARPTCSGSQGLTASRKGKASSRKGKHVKRRCSNEGLP